MKTILLCASLFIFGCSTNTNEITLSKNETGLRIVINPKKRIKIGENYLYAYIMINDNKEIPCMLITSPPLTGPLENLQKGLEERQEIWLEAGNIKEFYISYEDLKKFNKNTKRLELKEEDIKIRLMHKGVASNTVIIKRNRFEKEIY